MSCELCSFVDELEIINDIKFTIKEIDVISALINGKSIKSIAVLLNLSPKTVETHLRNIKQKLNCSSKETVIDFIENSNKYLLFNKHYTNLLINAEFERLLKKIGKIGQEIRVKCSKVCNKVIQHLNMCNIQINDKASVIFDCKAKDYYLGFLDLIQELRQDVITDKQIEEFKKFYEEKTTNVVVVKDIKNNNIFTRKNKRYLTYIATIVLVIISLFICINYENPIQLRMDIPKIHEEVLLKRSQITRQIDRILDKQEGIKVVVLTGPGGAGKTTIAREYIIAQSSNVIWEINAETENSIVNSLGDLANGLAKTKEQKEKLAFINSIKEYKEKNKRLLEFISGLLNKAKKWYLLFDNVDDFYMVKKYIPYNEKTWGKGIIIITTRNENIKNVNYLHKDYVVAITDLSIEESSRLCSDIMNVENKKSIQEFVKKLPPHPLDISAAAYYMKNTGTSFEDYLRETNNRDFNKTQRNIQRDSIGYEKTREVILKSNFDSICKQNSEFKELLLFVSLLDSQNIPISYLKQLKDPITVDNFIYNLRKHSLIIPNKDNTFSIHRSTQSFGIRYVNSSVTQSEITQYLDRIVNVMTPYKYIWWRWYNEEPKHKISVFDRKLLIPNLYSILDKIKIYKLSKVWDEYKIKISLAILFAYGDMRLPKINYCLAKEILISKHSKCLSDYDKAVLLLYSAKISRDYGKYKKFIQYTNNCLDICKKIKYAQNLEAMGKAYLARNYFYIGEFKQGKKLFKESIQLTRKVPQSYKIIATVANQYLNSFSKYCVSKFEIKKAILFAEEALDVAVIGNKKNIKSATIYDIYSSAVTDLMITLINISNKIYDKNLLIKYFLKTKKLFEQKSDCQIAFPMQNLKLQMEYAIFLLNTNKVINAHKNFTQIMLNMCSQKIFHKLYGALIYLSITNMRLNNLFNASENCKLFTDINKNLNIEYDIWLNSIFYYNMSIIKYKQKEYELSLKHFSEFFKRMKEFCKGFLDESVYNNLEKEKIFEIIKEPKDIQKCLDNSLKIFTAIYGKDHSFVKDYVAENCKNRSWLYEHIKITGYYLQYYWDCFMKFLSFNPFAL